MQKYIIFIYSLAICFLFGCQDDAWLEGQGSREQNGDVPVEFITELPQSGFLTRAGGDGSIVGEKTEFEDGDIIQVVANFYRNTSDEQEEFLSSVCSYLTYDKDDSSKELGKWVDSNSKLYWPSDSEWAVFSAFYYPGYDGMLQVGSESRTILLDSLDITTDPLMVEKTGRIEYGHAVKLQFEHVCTQLILTDLKEVVADSFDRLWLKDNGTATGGDGQKKNAFYIKLEETQSGMEMTTENPNKELSLEFEWTTKVATGQSAVLVGGRKVTPKSQEESEEDVHVFFLPPGDYSDASLTRRLGRSLLSWTDVNELQNLKAGHSYIVSLSDISGNIIVDEDDDWWKDEEDGYIKASEFILQDFLDAVAQNHNYSYTDKESGKTIQVLESNGNYVTLLTGIDFEGSRKFKPVTLNDGVIFDGGGYFFKNVKRNIFDATNGKIQNLGIKDSRLEQVQLKDNSNVGLLAREINDEVTNLRVENVGIEISSISSSGDNVFSVGVLGGIVNAEISEIEIENIEVAVNKTSIEIGTLYLGGLVGQLGVDAGIKGVSVSGTKGITITNALTVRTGNIYTGGLVGVSACNILDCNIRADVDASNADGGAVYTGGMVGYMRGTEPAENQEGKSQEKVSHIQIGNSLNEGTIKGGACHYYTDSKGGHSSTGGLVGYSLRMVDIRNCTVGGKISSNIIGNKGSQIYYSIGGVIGTVMPADSQNPEDYVQIQYNQVYAGIDSEIKTEDEFCMVGWLAGIAPENVDDDETNIVKVQTKFENVGRPSNDLVPNIPNE